MMMLRFFDAVCLLVYSPKLSCLVTYSVSQMTLTFFCCFPNSIIINIAAMLHVFVRYLLYLLLLQCLFPGENKELN